MRKKIFIGALCTLCLFTACGKKEDTVTTTEATTEAVTTTEATTEETTTEEVVEEVYFQNVSDISSLVQGGFTKEQLAYVLGVAKNTEKSTGILVEDLDMYALAVIESSVTGIEFTTSDYTNYTCNLQMLNDKVSVITENVFDASNANVNGDSVTFTFPAGGCPSISSSITKAVYKPDEVMYVEFTCHINIAGEDLYNGTVTAVMMPQANGLYKLSELKDGSIADNFGSLDFGEVSDASGVSYDSVLDSIAYGTNEYGLSDAFMGADTFSYAMYDMNADGSKELIVCGEVPDGKFMLDYFYIFAIKDGSVAKVSDEYSCAGMLLTLPDKNSIYYVYESDMTGNEIVYHEVSYDGNIATDAEFIRSGLGESSAMDNNSELVRTDIADRSALTN